MGTCFVMQPFDRGKYDARYVEIFEPAIRAAGLEPYRVDRDNTVQVIAEAIEGGIRNAEICLAEITEDNPNVCYELGFAVAAGKPVIMVCSDERVSRKYPFDIQHRIVIRYGTRATSDFLKLQKEITERLKAVCESYNQRITEEVVEPVVLSEEAILVFKVLVQKVYVDKLEIFTKGLRRLYKNTRLSVLDVDSGFEELLSKKMVETEEIEYHFGSSEFQIEITDEGMEYIKKNRKVFNL